MAPGNGFFFFFFKEFLPTTDLLPTQDLLHSPSFYTEKLPQTGFRCGCSDMGWGLWPVTHQGWGGGGGGLKIPHGKGKGQEDITGTLGGRNSGGTPQMLQLDPCSLSWWAQHTLLEEQGLIPTPGARCWETGSRGQRGEGNLYSAFQNEEIRRRQELRSQIIAEGMPACQVFLQPWLPRRNTDR